MAHKETRLIPDEPKKDAGSGRHDTAIPTAVERMPDLVGDMVIVDSCAGLTAPEEPTTYICEATQERPKAPGKRHNSPGNGLRQFLAARTRK